MRMHGCDYILCCMGNPTTERHPFVSVQFVKSCPADGSAPLLLGPRHAAARVLLERELLLEEGPHLVGGLHDGESGLDGTNLRGILRGLDEVDVLLSEELDIGGLEEATARFGSSQVRPRVLRLLV